MLTGSKKFEAINSPLNEANEVGRPKLEEDAG